MGNSPERVRGLVTLGWDLLQAGRPRDASLAFGRVLMRHPAHAGARRGLALARSSTAESCRDLDTRLDEAKAAVESGERQRAHELLEHVAAQGADSARIFPLLDRLDAREGRIARRLSREPGAAATSAALAPGRTAWSRRAFVFAWSLLFASLATGMAASWDRIVGGLVKPPVPESGPPSVTEIPASTPGERALRQARLMLDERNPAGAVAALDRVTADDPAFPFSRRLRSRAQEALRVVPPQ